MNIFNKVTLQSMKKSRTRTIVTVIGVILSAAMITAVATFAVSLQNYMVNGATQKYGGWHVAFLDVDSSFVQERTHDHGVANTATFENMGYATLNGGKNPNKPYLFIAGFSKEAFDTLPITLISGRLPKNSGEILVPAHVAANGGVKFSVGDTLSLAVGSRMEVNKNLGQHDPYVSEVEPGKVKETLVPKAERTYTVVGICERPAFEEYCAPGYTLITTTDPADQADSFSLFVTLTNPRQVHTYAINTAESQAYIFNDDVLRFMGLSDDNMFNALLYWVGGILIALIMIGSIFLIYNSFNISLNERTRQFGILSSVGATAKQLRNSVLFEGLCIGAIGVPIGVIVGIASIRLVISVVAGNFGNILYSTVPLTLTVSTPAIVIAAVVSMVTILISAYIPARKAANTPVMESIRQTNEIKVESKAVKTSKFAQRIYGLEGTLALKNFKRNKKRYRSIVLSLTLSVVLFVSASAFGMYLKQAAELSVVDVDYDICFSTQDMDEREVFRLYDELKTADGVYESSYQAILEYSCAVKTSNFSDSYREFAGYASPNETDNLSMDIQFIEDSEYLRFIEGLGLPAEEYTIENAKMTAVAKFKKVDDTKDRKTELIDMFASRSMNFTIAPKINDKPKMEQGQNINITFVDTIPLDTVPRQSSAPKSTVFMVVAPYQLKERFEIPGEHEELGLTFLSKNPSQSAAQMEAMIQRAGITSEYSLYNVYKILEQNRNIIFVVDVFTYVFVIMISLIAMANVFNTISTNIRLRRRELAMLRSVGMSEGDFNKMMCFECAFYGMRTLLFGLPIGGILSWLIYKGLIIGGAHIDFVFPWGSMGISVFSVFFVVFITMLYAISKIKKENIIDALRDDMT
ncbi:FtsX-like permease family protein [Lutibacter sp. B2]|nr:FtsX-like permease family protein [Lutibacter sp. B2]